MLIQKTLLIIYVDVIKGNKAFYRWYGIPVLPSVLKITQGNILRHRANQKWHWARNRDSISMTVDFAALTFYAKL